MSSLRIEPTMTIQIRTCCLSCDGVMLGRLAGSGVGRYNTESPSQGAKGSTLLYEDDSLCPSNYCILFIYGGKLWRPPSPPPTHTQAAKAVNKLSLKNIQYIWPFVGTFVHLQMWWYRYDLFVSFGFEYQNQLFLI